MGTKIKRFVFDTNIVISSLVFQSAGAKRVRTLWLEGQLIPVVSKETTEELIRVLAYPKFKLSALEQNILRDEYLLYAELCLDIRSFQSIYPCRDPWDQKFIDLALSSQVEGLMSGDQDILIMKDVFPIPIYGLKSI